MKYVKYAVVVLNAVMLAGLSACATTPSSDRNPASADACSTPSSEACENKMLEDNYRLSTFHQNRSSSTRY